MTVQETEEGGPNVLLPLVTVVEEDLDTGTVLLEHVVNHHEDVLDGLVFGHVSQQREPDRISSRRRVLRGERERTRTRGEELRAYILTVLRRTHGP